MARIRRIPAAIAISGLVVGVCGTFLPWFRSGSVERHSYQAAVLADRFGLFGSAPLRVWLAVPLLSALCVALVVLGLARTAAITTLVLSLAVGTVALLTAVQAGNSDGLVGITPAGPVTTLAGACLALAGALAQMIPRTGGRS